MVKSHRRPREGRNDDGFGTLPVLVLDAIVFLPDPGRI